MKKYKVYHSARFDEELSKFDSRFAKVVDKIEDDLIINPYTGKPLGVKWFREKKHEAYRIYYIIYEDLDSVFMVAISGKKDQQRVINTIRLLLDSFGEELRRMINNEST